MGKPLTKLSARALPLLRDNVDTDAIIPSREIKGVTKTGLASGLFAGWRYTSEREINSDFLLNWPQYRGVQILLSGSNFGCGSSREQAVWSLAEFGFRVIVAESFGEIFYNNCIANGVLPIQLTKKNITKLAKIDTDIKVNLVKQTISGTEFKISAPHKHMLVQGLDAIDLTRGSMSKIEEFEQSYFVSNSWTQLK